MCDVTERIEKEPRLMAKVLDMTVRLQKVGKTLETMTQAAVAEAVQHRDGADGKAKAG